MDRLCNTYQHFHTSNSINTSLQKTPVIETRNMCFFLVLSAVLAVQEHTIKIYYVL
jgi:hypothetical protein